MTDVVDAERIGDVALATVQRDSSGVMALAMMTEADFEARLTALKQGQDRVRRIQRELMVEDEDFGVIPGTKKPTLLKPGAEKLCTVYGLVATFVEEWLEGDGITRPHLRCRMKCLLRRGSELGPVVAVGVGAANSWERKHRYRGGGRACPSCGVEGSIRRSSFADQNTGDKGWYCSTKSQGCNGKFTSDDPAITEQQAGQVENPDPYDGENTLFKMSKKRAYIDATLNATATSGLFTQDLEDSAGSHTPAEYEPRAAQRSDAPAADNGPAERTTTTTSRAPAPQRKSSDGTLPKWEGPCPKCKVTGAVMVSKRDAKSYYCFPKSTRAKGCGETFGPEGAADAAEKVTRQYQAETALDPKSSPADLYEYGVE